LPIGDEGVERADFVGVATQGVQLVGLVAALGLVQTAGAEGPANTREMSP
jgi:hypothetical protein